MRRRDLADYVGSRFHDKTLKSTHLHERESMTTQFFKIALNFSLLLNSALLFAQSPTFPAKPEKSSFISDVAALLSPVTKAMVRETPVPEKQTGPVSP